MKALYTLLILLIPYVGFCQNYQEIIVDSLSTGAFGESALAISNDGFIVTTSDGESVYDANSLKKFDFNGNMVFDVSGFTMDLTSKNKIILTSNNKIIYAFRYYGGFECFGCYGVRFKEYTSFGAQLSNVHLTHQYDWKNCILKNYDFREEIIELDDEYLVLSRVDSNHCVYDFNGSLISSENFKFDGIKISKDWSSTEYISLTNDILNNSSFDSTEYRTHFVDSENNCIYFLYAKNDSQTNFYIYKTNFNLEIIEEIPLNSFEFDDVNVNDLNLDFILSYSNENEFLISCVLENNETLSKDIFINKFNQNGDLLWQNNYGGYNDDILYSTLELSNGNIIFSAKFGAQQLGGNDSKLAIVKLNQNGDFIEELSFDIDNNDTFINGDKIHELKIYNDSYVALIGYDGVNRLLIFENSEPSHIKENFIDKNSFKMYNVLGKESSSVKNQPLIKIYENGLVEKVLIIE